MDHRTRLLPFKALRQEGVIFCFLMADMGDDSQPYGMFIQALCRRRTSNPAAVFLAGMFGNGGLSPRWAGGKKPAYLCRKLFYVLLVERLSAFCFSLSPAEARFTVCQAFHFSLFKGLGFDQQALAFITFARPAPAQHDGCQGGVFPCPPGERSIAGGEEEKVVQVGAGQAERAYIFNQPDPGLAADLLATIAAGDFTGGDEYF
jgi:hypothetical protein